MAGAVSSPPCAFCGSTPQSPRTEHSARLMVDGLRAGALAVGPDGHICDANRGASQILRVPIEELRKAKIEDVLAPLDDLRPVMSADPGERVELSLRLRDGHPATVGCSLSEIHEDGRVGWVVLFQDISALVELRTQRDRLLQFAAVADSLPSILHEIRNPLASVTSMLEVLAEEVDGHHQDDLQTVLDELRRIGLCLQGIGGLHSDLRAKAPEAIDRAVREACHIMRSTGEDRGVHVRCDIPDMPPLPLRGAVVRGIVFNLMRNAIDACAGRGEVHLAAAFDDRARRLTMTGAGQRPRDDRGRGEALLRHLLHDEGARLRGRLADLQAGDRARGR